MSDTSEPAFPVVGHFYGERLGGQLGHGMTLRDYFAAKAMAAAMRNWQGSNDANDNAIARSAYMMADAMLKERAK